MARRASYTSVKRIGFTRPEHVSGMGDRPFRVFQCLNPNCTHILTVEENETEGDFRIECPACNFVLAMGEALKLYDYEVTNKNTNEIVASAPALVLHEEYLMRAARFKYCIICGTLKPLTEFDLHSARVSKRQGECNMCKQDYNSVKNGTRTTEQHRIASQQRRLYMQFDETNRLDINAIVARFDGKCFYCGENVEIQANDEGESLKANLDHTRPVYYLWPLTTNNATLLCREHNGRKGNRWPGEFYTNLQCRNLSRLTGIDYRELIGAPRFNPAALEKLQQPTFVESLFEKFARYPEELLKLRNRILDTEGFDFLEVSNKLSPTWKDQANALRRS